MKSSFLTKVFSEIVNFGNRWFTLSGVLFKSDELVFFKIEILMLVMLFFCMAILFGIHLLPYWLGLVVSFILVQRVFEFLIVYSRNFILNQGRVFTHFPHSKERGQWLMLMFFLNIFQVCIIFAIWYRFLSFSNPAAFSTALSPIDSLYFSLVAFFTIGFGDIVPLTLLAKILVMLEGVLMFYTIVIVINGLIAIHFRRPDE